MRDITFGQTSIETWKYPKNENYDQGDDSMQRFLCVSSSEPPIKRRVFPIEPDEGLYDLGWLENWRHFFKMIREKGIFRYETQ